MPDRRDRTCSRWTPIRSGPSRVARTLWKRPERQPSSRSLPRVSVTQVASEQEVYAEKRNRLVIRHSSGDDLVAYIEIVSSGNKSSRRALDRFLDKACAAIEHGIHLLVIDPYPPGTLDPNGIHGAIWNELDPGAPFQFPDGRRLTLASYCAVRPPQAYVEPVETGMTLPGIALFLDPQWYVTVPLEGPYSLT